MTMNQRIGRAAAALAVLGGLALGPGLRAADLELTLNARWRGGWVVVKPAIASGCDGFYSDNAVVGERAYSRARRRFERRELARVERIDVKRARIDVFLDLAEAVLEPRREGPFTLYEAFTCRAQLQVPVEAKADAARVQARLAGLLELHPNACSGRVVGVLERPAPGALPAGLRADRGAVRGLAGRAAERRRRRAPGRRHRGSSARQGADPLRPRLSRRLRRGGRQGARPAPATARA